MELKELVNNQSVSESASQTNSLGRQLLPPPPYHAPPPLPFSIYRGLVVFITFRAALDRATLAQDSARARSASLTSLPAVEYSGRGSFV